MPDERFRAELDRLIERSINIDDDAARDMLNILRGVRDRIASHILDAEGFDLLHYEGLKRGVEIEFNRFAQELKAKLDDETLRAFDLGQEIIDAPLISAGAGIAVSAMPQLSVETINAFIQRNTQFITNLTTEAANRISGQLLLSITGEQAPQTAMRAIGNILKDKSIFKTIADRAEAIVRTEVNAALNMGTINRLEQAQQQIGGMKKYWIHTGDDRTRPSHRAVGNRTNPGYGGKPIAVNRLFLVSGPNGVERAKGPHDPRLSGANSVMCRCRLGFTVSLRVLTNVL